MKRQAVRAPWARLWQSGVSAIMLSTALAAPGWAQASSAEADAARAEDIIVTAQKRNERLQDVPIAITVINPTLLSSTNSRNLAELQGAVPGVFFGGNNGGGRTYVTLRGATGLAHNTGDEPVAFYMDDIYLARGVTTALADLLDVGSIEVVRGPQGTLQGRNATAGAILIRSADPTDELSGRFSAGISDPLELRMQGAISGPLTETVKARLSAGYNYERGWALNPVTGRHIAGGKSHQGRLILTHDKGPLSVRLVADYAHVTNEPALFRYANTPFAAGNGALVPAGTATPNTPLPQAVRDEIFKHNRIALDPGTRTTVEGGGLSAKIEYSFGAVDLISVTGWRKTDVEGRNDSDGLAVAKMGYNFNDDQSEQLSQEIRLQSSGNQRFSWILGFYFFDEDQYYVDDLFNLKLSVPTNTMTRYIGTIDTRSYAGFADATFKVTDQLSVIGGVRYTSDRKKLASNIIATNLDTRVATTTPYSPPAKTWKDTSYRGKLVYKPTSDMMIFAGYGRGYRSGAFNPFAVQAPYKPEIIKSWEGGSKGDLFDRRLTYSVAAYHSTYSDLQLRAGVPTGGAIIYNAARAEINGAELELTARPAHGTRLSGNLAYTDAKFTSFPAARDTLDRPVDASGNRLPRTPRWQYYVSAEQDFPLTDDLLLTAEANYRWRGRVYFFFTNQNDQPWQDPPGAELGARLTIRPDSNRWSVSLFGTNLTNERIVNTGTLTFSYPQVGLNKPRSIGVTTQFNF